MLGLREYLQSYHSCPGIEIVEWEKQEGIVDVPPVIFRKY